MSAILIRNHAERPPRRFSFDGLSAIGRPSLIVIWLAAILHSAPPTNADDPAPAVRIRYQELIDETVVGHSGRLARDVLKQLELTTPEGAAKERVLREMSGKLQLMYGELGGTKDEEHERRLKAEIKKFKERMSDKTALRLAADEYLKKNKAQVELDAALKRLKTKPELLMADVEAVCEPAAVVLNDALAQKVPDTFNQNLVELAAFYPAGKAEPAWADLVRTRRFVVYSDGKTYCRLFLPGKTAKDAWNQAYPVVRHVLRSLLPADVKERELTADVYAYENDIARTTFTLHLTKSTENVTAKKLSAPPGQTSLDLNQLAAFFSAGHTLAGCGVDKNGQLVLIGSKEKGLAPTLEGQPVSLADLAVAYRASAYAGHGESYMSLDPAADPRQVNVNFGGRLHDTRLGWVAYRCDLRFKTLGDDFDAVTFDNRRDEIRKAMDDYSSQQERAFADAAFRPTESESTRFWFYPDDFKIVEGAGQKSCLVTHPRFKAAAERSPTSFDKNGEPAKVETPQWTSRTLAHFNANYEKFAALFPEVAELDHAARLLAVAEWLHHAKHKRGLALDLDDLLTVTLPAAPTPRQRDQLRINYAVKKTGIPAEFKAYCLVTPGGKAAFERDQKAYEKPKSEWTIMRVTGGGLNFSARESVSRPTKATDSQQTALRELMESSDPVRWPDGKEYLNSKPLIVKQPAASGPPLLPPGNDSITVIPPPDKGGGPPSNEYRGPGGRLHVTIHDKEEVKRVHQAPVDAYFRNGHTHSIWVGEKGSPERFAVSTSEGIIAYRLEARDDVLTVQRASTRRAPTDAELNELVRALARPDVAVSQVWNTVPLDTGVRAIDVTPSRVSLVYYKEGNDAVVRVTKPGDRPTVMRGEAALQRMHEASREKARAYSVPNKVELLHLSEDGNDLVLQIGQRDPIRMEKTKWEQWIAADGKAPPPPLNGIYKQLTEAGSELVVMRDALQSQPQRFRDRPDARGTDRHLDALSITGVLKAKLPGIRVSYDDPSPLVPKRIAAEPLVKSVADVGLAVPPGEAHVDDKGILNGLVAAFKQAKLPLINKPSDLEKVGNVIVVTAHNNEALFDYLQTLGDHQINGKSALDGKMLMLTTCFEAGNPNMVSELLRRYNCAGVHVQTEVVNKNAVSLVMMEFSKLVRDTKPDGPPKRLRELYEVAIRRLLESDEPSVEDLKPELKKLLRAHVQWCAAAQAGDRRTVKVFKGGVLWQAS